MLKALYFDNSLPRIIALKVASVLDKNAALGPVSPVHYAEVPEPKIPDSNWIKVKNTECGLCGTDLHLIYMDMDPKCFPAAIPGLDRKYLGHESVGEIVEAGSNVSEFQPGDRVVQRIDWPSCYQMEIDPPCSRCSEGSYMLCENLGKKALPTKDTGGGFSPFMIMHKSQPFKIPKNVPDDRAVLIEPVAVGVHAALHRKPKAGEKVLIVGAGTIGLLTLAVTKHLSPKAEFHIIARYPFQEKAALAAGASHVIMGSKNLYGRIAEASGARHIKGYFGNEVLLGGYDLVYDSIGSDRTINDSLRWARAGGQVVLIGVNFTPGKIDYSPIWNQEVRLTGVNSHATEENGKTSFDIAAQLLAKKNFPVDGIVTHRFAMDDYREAIKTFQNKSKTGAIKIVLEHS